MKIIEFCNANSGFMSAILSALSFLLSAIAIFISVKTENRQIQISLLEKRLDVYSHIQKICSFMAKFPVAAQQRPYIRKCFLSCTFLYQLDSQEYKICTEINMLKKKASNTTDPEKQHALEAKWMKRADMLCAYYITETRNISELQTNLHFLFSPAVETRARKLLTSYENFLLGHVFYTNLEFESVIDGMIELCDVMGLSSLLEDIEQQTLKQKQRQNH